MLQFKFRKKPTPRAEQRKYFRFPLMEHLNIKVFVRILPYYRSEELEGILDNLSAGGMALQLSKSIPQKSFLYIQVIIPGGLCIASHCEIKHTKKLSTHKHVHGIEFLDLPAELKNLILFMSREYLECSGRIKHFKKTNCSPRCTAYGICSRHEKIYVFPPRY